MIRVGVKNRGCSGLAYHLEYVDKPGSFDEEVVQDGVKVLIDSKALFSIIGSEMDWVEDKLQARFVFRNPNISKSCVIPQSVIVNILTCVQRSNVAVASRLVYHDTFQHSVPAFTFLQYHRSYFDFEAVHKTLQPSPFITLPLATI